MKKDKKLKDEQLKKVSGGRVLITTKCPGCGKPLSAWAGSDEWTTLTCSCGKSVRVRN